MCVYILLKKDHNGDVVSTHPPPFQFLSPNDNVFHMAAHFILGPIDATYSLLYMELKPKLYQFHKQVSFCKTNCA
jgi:hypothetical protein